MLAPPTVGPLCLGSIIRSTSTPQFPLNGANIAPVTNENLPVVENDWKKTISTESGLGFGVYAHFLQLVMGGLGLGPEVDVRHSNRAMDTFAFDTVKTVSFEPTPEYIAEAVKAPAVQAYLKEPRQRFAPVVSLFLVTGMKIVKGARIKYSASTDTSINGNIGVDVVPLGVSAGPKGHWSRVNEEDTEFSRSSEFIFAFRVKRLRFGRGVKSQDYNKGALFAIGDHKIDCETESILIDDVDGSGIKNATLIPDTGENDKVFCITS